MNTPRRRLALGLTAAIATAALLTTSTAATATTVAREHIPAALSGPDNPFMAARGVGGPHNDSYSTNRSPQRGPGGAHVTSSQTLYGNPCPTILVNRAGFPVGNCVDGVVSADPLRLRHSLRILDPDTLDVLASMPLTPLGQDGLYNYLDDKDRIVLGDGNGHVLRVAQDRDARGRWSLRVVDDWDVSAHVTGHCGGTPSCDYIVSVKPDWLGRIWFSTTAGVMGVINPRSGRAHSTRLPAGEQVIKAISASPLGVAVASDHALYLFTADPLGRPRQLWREAYDRGSGIKPGQRNQGTGTSPTFFGIAGTSYLAIMDNADGRGNMLVYRAVGLPGRRLICTVPLFAPNTSATDDTFIATGRGIIATNTYGYDYFNYTQPLAGGITRIDVRPGESGCDTVWTNPAAATTMPKLAAGTGHLHLIERSATATGPEYVHVAIDARSGATVGRQTIGYDPTYEGIQSSGTFAPTGVYYQGTLAGIVRISGPA